MAAECFVAGAAAFQVYSLLDWLRGRLAAPIPPPQTPADLIVITGASRGFGQAVAVALAASSDGTGRTMVLTARTAGGLDHTAALVEKSGGGKWTVKKVVADLSLRETLDRSLSEVVAALPSSAERVLLVNNAGSLGGVTKSVADMVDIEPLREYLELNVVSVIALTSRVLQKFAKSQCTIVNVSSLLAVVPFSGYGLYATGKAARDMLHAVIAKEHAEADVKTLNYAPGPLDTDMQTEIRDTHMDAEQREFYSKMKTEGTLLTPEQSAAKLVTVLQSGAFDSGAHVDYYDLP
eukprot:m.13092 g.13092  ORF g.13092 m.13092 type:complete len:293 (-) comp4617_c0_seq2:107-985(-)